MSKIFNSFIKSQQKLISAVFIFSLIFGNGALFVIAATPAVQTTIRVVADGSAPFDTTTYDVATGNNGANDANATNGVVRIQDYLTYRIEASLNDKDDTNLVSRVIVDPQQQWESIPASCQTAGVTPVSAILDFDTVAPGNDKRVLLCNLGNTKEGVKYTVNAVAVVNSNASNANLADQTACNTVAKPATPTLTPTLDTTSGCLSAYVYTKSDNSNAADFTPTNLLVTTGFRVDLSKTLPFRTGTPSDYNPTKAELTPGGLSGFVLDYTVDAKAVAGSELVKNTAGKANFTLQDCYLDNNSTNGNNTTDFSCGGSWINSSNARLYNWDTTLPTAAQDGCVAVTTEVTDANLICTQPGGPGTKIIIQLNNVDVTYPNIQGLLFKIKVKLWIPVIQDVNSDPANCAGTGNCTHQTINKINFSSFDYDPTSAANPITAEPTSVTGLANYNGTGEPQTNNTVNYPLVSQILNGESARQYLDAILVPAVDNFNYGLKNVIAGEIVPVSIRVNTRKGVGNDTRNTSCSKIDTTNFEFAGVPTTGYNSSVPQDSPSATNGKKYNPYVFGQQVTGTPIPPSYSKGGSVVDADGVTVYEDANIVFPEYRYEYAFDPTYSTVPTTLRTDTCPDDLDGNPLTVDWFSNPALVPGGPTAINKVRVIRDRIDQISRMQAYFDLPQISLGGLTFTYLTKVKSSPSPYPVTIGAVNYNFMPSYLNNEFYNYLSNSTSSGEPPISTSTIGNSSFGFNANNSNADRVNLIAAKYTIDKKVLNSVVYETGDIVEYEVTPKIIGNLAVPISFTITDTLPSGNFTLVPGSFIEDTSTPANGSYVFPTTQTGNDFTIDLNGADTANSLRKFKFKVKISQGAPAGSFINKVKMIAKNIPSVPQITQLITDSQQCGSGTRSGQVITCTRFDDPYSEVSAQILAQNSFSIFKEVQQKIDEVNSDIDYKVTYIRAGSESYGPGDFIDVLPYNGDGEDGNATNFTADRTNTFTGAGTGSVFTEGSVDTYPGLASAPTGTNGEVFTYTNATPGSIKADVCHSANQPAAFVPTTGHPCYLQYTLNGNKFMDGVATGSGVIKWCTAVQFGTAGCPTALDNVTAVRWASTAYPSTASAGRVVSLKIKPRGNKENDVYCNSAFGRVPEISLEVISNDVCAKVVSGSISGTVWHDKTTNNGTLELTDDKLAGKIIALLDATGNPVLDPITNTPITATTDTNGIYTFTNLKTGTYRTQVQNPPVGSAQTYDNDDGSLATTYGTPNNSGNVVVGKVFDDSGNFEDIADFTNVNFGYAGLPSVEIDKKIYKGHSSGAGCPTAVDELVVVDKSRSLVNVTYCFEVKNTGLTYLDTVTLSDPTLNITQTNMTLLSGPALLPPGGTQVYYYETALNKSFTNTASTTARPVSSIGVPTGQPNVTDDDPAGARLIYVFDPPFGIKTGTYQGKDIVRWTMVWINTAPVTANNAEILDEIPIGTTFNGGLVCTGAGVTVVISCAFENPSTAYPRGRVRVLSNIGPDVGGTTADDSENELQISFDNLVAPNTNDVSNQANLNWEGFKVPTKEPVKGGATKVIIPKSITALIRTGGQGEDNSVFATMLFILSGIAVSVFVKRRYSKK
jgi:hypothetical protein